MYFILLCTVCLFKAQMDVFQNASANFEKYFDQERSIIKASFRDTSNEKGDLHNMAECFPKF